MNIETNFIEIVSEVTFAMNCNPFSSRTKAAREMLNAYIAIKGWSDDEYELAFNSAFATLYGSRS